MKSAIEINILFNDDFLFLDTVYVKQMDHGIGFKIFAAWIFGPSGTGLRISTVTQPISLSMISWLKFSNASPKKCFYDQRVTPYPLPKNESTGEFLLGTAETLVDLDEPSNKLMSGIIFKDLVNLIDNYYYYYENGSSPVDKQNLLENGINFNDPQIQQILDISSGSIYKATHANHGGRVRDPFILSLLSKIKNGDQLYFSPCSIKSNKKISPQVVQKNFYGEEQLWCAVSHLPCGMESKVKDDEPLAYRCHTRADCKGPNHETKSCDNSENYFIR